jgi:hypothetical protein
MARYGETLQLLTASLVSNEENELMLSQLFKFDQFSSSYKCPNDLIKVNRLMLIEMYQKYGFPGIDNDKY